MQVFDLKGSLRNRLVNLNDESLTADGAELVLLDENFLRSICQHPLYIQPQVKLALSKALSVDTEFLASLYVMDYSLLVGIDEGRKELVLGIIDYIRTFTWDKRLEMVVKKGFAMGDIKSCRLSSRLNCIEVASVMRCKGISCRCPINGIL